MLEKSDEKYYQKLVQSLAPVFLENLQSKLPNITEQDTDKLCEEVTEFALKLAIASKIKFSEEIEIRK
jgi:hypothetical protein